jgi:hypothetical protein
VTTLSAVQPPASEELALAALTWLEATAVADGDGVWWSGKPSSAEPDPTLYQGTAGIVLALLEADAHFGVLEPSQGWAMGNAGLIREQLRHARITAGHDPSYAVQWPDHPAPGPAPAGRAAAREMSSSEG